jgi:hypothetical protein
MSLLLTALCVVPTYNTQEMIQMTFLKNIAKVLVTVDENKPAKEDFVEMKDAMKDQFTNAQSELHQMLAATQKAYTEQRITYATSKLEKLTDKYGNLLKK